MKLILSVILMAMVTVHQAHAQNTNTALPDHIKTYLQLKDALFNADVAKAAGAATVLQSQTVKSGMADDKKIAHINAELKTIAASKDLEQQRNAFAKLSQYFITAVKNKPLKGVTLYADYCPMARDGKGAYWLSTSKSVTSNPYFGSGMPNCGTVDETISE